MKTILLLAQFTPDITYSPIDFNVFLNVFANNFLLGLALVFGIATLAFLCYMSVCFLGMFFSRLIGYDGSPTQYTQMTLQEPTKI